MPYDKLSGRNEGSERRLCENQDWKWKDNVSDKKRHIVLRRYGDIKRQQENYNTTEKCEICTRNVLQVDKFDKSDEKRI